MKQGKKKRKKNGSGIAEKVVSLLADAKQIDGNFVHLKQLHKSIDQKAFATNRARITSTQQALEDREQELSAARKAQAAARRALLGDMREMTKLIKRVRNGVLFAYGDDAPELDLVGVKRVSERKRPVRSKKATTPNPTRG